VEHFAPKPPERGEMFGKLRLLSLADAASAPPRHYLLRGLIAPREMSLWWGAPKCGKSFLLLRLTYGLALGEGMWGRGAKPCRICYIAAEGEGGFAARLLALREAMGDAGENFRYIAQRATLGAPADDLEHAIEAARHMRADIIVPDTLARTFGTGEENSATDMGAFVASMDRIREETGAHVAVIHHGRRDGANARGSIALEGAADLIVKVARGEGDGPNLATVMAAKDDVDGIELPFRLRVMERGAGDDGEMRRTCIAEECDAAPATRSKPLPKATRTALAILADLIARQGTPLPHGAGWPDATLSGVPEATWRAECETRRLSLAEKPEDRARTFRNAAGELRDTGLVGMRDGLVWMVRDLPPDAPEGGRPAG
jgi:hypothetical protein